MLTSEEIARTLAGAVSAASVIRRDEPLAKRTTMRVGGPADVYLEPASEADLAAVLRVCSSQQIPFFILGRGSNLLVKDGGVRGVVICLARTTFGKIEFIEGALHCGAAARLNAIANEARRRGMAGLEFMEGIPGSLGGALRMNAGAMGAAMFDVVETVRSMDFSGQMEERPGNTLGVAYRGCAALKTSIALGAVLRGKPGAPEDIAKRMSEYSRKRWDSQPSDPSAGCIFKNVATIPAGRLIDELGLKGRRVGGASVSMEHGNFMVNDGTATARDVLELIEIVKDAARTGRGLELQTEVEIIGE